MKNFKSIFLALGLLTFGNVYAGDHGGGNGGSDLEIELKKKSLQIGHFLKSEMGRSAFDMINPDSILKKIEIMDIDVIAPEVIDKYGTTRTCVNEPEKNLITCNAEKVSSMMKNDDVLITTLFHEILGLMKIELGHQENVSMYPISSMMLQYAPNVLSIIVSEKDLRPEYYGVDSRSYGITVQNRKTKETIRLVCLNNSVEIHRCRNYSLVRKAGEFQAPLIKGIVSLSPNEISSIRLEAIKYSDIKKLEKELEELQSNGFDFLTLKNTITTYDGQSYRVGTGLTQMWLGRGCPRVLDGKQVLRPVGDLVVVCTFFPIINLVTLFVYTVDGVTEVSKQALNVGIYPIKAIINGIRIGAINGKIKKYNKQLAVATDILNLREDLSIIDTKKSVSDEEYNMLITIITNGVSQIRGKQQVMIH